MSDDPKSIPESDIAPAPAPQVAEVTSIPGGSESAGDNFSLDGLLDVSLPVIIEIGRTSLPLGDVMKLKSGSVVQLDRLVGDAVDILVSDRKLAEGEVVVIGDHFGVRITRVVSHARPEAAA